MRSMLTAFYARPLALYLALSFLALSSVAGPAEAMLLPAAPVAGPAAGPAAGRTADRERVQQALESRVLQQRLMDYGLSPEETAERIDALSDEQLHQLASNIDALQPGGDAVSTVLALALIAGLVVLIIFILQGRIAIERK